MDPITAAIVAALTAGAISGVTKVGEQVVSDAYDKLKELIKKKFGAKSQVAKAVHDLEVNPSSKPRQGVLSEEIVSAKADEDTDLLKAAQTLLQAIKAKPNGQQIIQSVMGDQNIQISGDGNVVSVGIPKNKK